MKIDTYLSIIAILISIISIVVSYIMAKQVNDSAQKDRISRIRQKLFYLSYEYDQLIDMEGKTTEKAREDVLKSAEVLRDISLLYEHNRYLFVGKHASMLSEKYDAIMSDNGSLPQIIEFIQAFYKCIDLELDK